MITANNQFSFINIILIIILLVFFPLNCKMDNPFGLKIEDVIEFDQNLNGATLFANGIDELKITVFLKGDTPDQQQITFKTDNGTFASISSSEASSNNQQEITIKAVGYKAEVFLISSIQVKDARVAASVGEFTILITIPFIRVYPERIILRSNSIRLKPDGNDSATLTAMLIPPEDKGTVSEKTRIIFTAEEVETGKSVPELYREALSDQKGEATTFLVGRTEGLIRITCFVAGKEEISDSILIEFTGQ